MIARKVAPRKRNAKRHKAEWLRAYGSKERVEFVAELPCIICKLRPCENAHTGRRSGAGRKADADTIVPLCLWHHAIYHNIGVETFVFRYRMSHADLDKAAAETEKLWAAHCEGKAVA